MEQTQSRGKDITIFTILLVLAILFLAPILIVLMNSFKGKFFISDTPFQFPNGDTFSGLATIPVVLKKSTSLVPSVCHSL